MKRIKALTLSLDGTVYKTTELVLPEDGSDVQCPACFNDKWTDVVSIIQRGFTEDQCLDVVRCDKCGNLFHAQYSVVSDGAIA